MLEFAGKLNLRLTTLPNTPVPTCKTLRNGRTILSQTDYCISNLRCLTQYASNWPPEVTRLDHRPLHTVLSAPALSDLEPPGCRARKSTMHIPIRQMPSQQLKSILLHADWPRRPFNVIAKLFDQTKQINLNKTKSSKIPPFLQL